MTQRTYSTWFQLNHILKSCNTANMAITNLPSLLIIDILLQLRLLYSPSKCSCLLQRSWTSQLLPDMLHSDHIRSPRRLEYPKVMSPLVELWDPSKKTLVLCPHDKCAPLSKLCKAVLGKTGGLKHLTSLNAKLAINYPKLPSLISSDLVGFSATFCGMMHCLCLMDRFGMCER